MDDQELRNRVIEKLLRGRYIGGKNVTVDTFVSRNLGVATHDEGKARDIIESEMIPDGAGSIARYGGQRDAIHLTDVEAAIAYLEANGGNVPFGFD